MIDLLPKAQGDWSLRSGLWVPFQKRPTCIDLFCGCGGFSLGMIQAGFEIVAAVDWDVAAMTTYMTNLGSYPINIHYIEPSDKERLNSFLERELKANKKRGIDIPLTSGSGWISNAEDALPVKNVWLGDVRKLKGKDILETLGMEKGEVDCVVGGPPCQGFSRANSKRNVMDPRNSLVFEFARLIIEIQPKSMVMENVPGIIDMVTVEGFPVLDELGRILEDGGFGTADAIKRSLLGTSGAGAVMNAKGKVKKSGSRHRNKAATAEKAVEQPTLF